MKYVIGYDLGTSYFKAVVIDERGDCVGIGRVKTPKKREGSIVTIAPDQFWKALRETTLAALGTAGIKPEDVSSISYASQTNTFLLLDEKRKPLTDFYVWSTVFDPAVDEKLSDLWNDSSYLAATGLGINGTGLTAAKLLWIQRHHPGIWNNVRYIANISDYFMYGLTEAWVADSSTSSLLGYLDINRGDWWQKALDCLGIDRAVLPRVIPMGDFAGTITKEGSSMIGLHSGIPVFAGGLDHVVAAIGAGLGVHANMSESTGTVLACLAVKPYIAPRERITIGPFPEPQAYAYLSFCESGAEVIEDYHDRCFPELTIDEMLTKVDQSPVGSSGIYYLDDPDSVLELPDRFIRERTDRTCSQADEIRGILEALAYRTLKLSEHLIGDHEIRQLVATGGGNRSRELLTIKADMFFSEIITCEQKELGAFGAALIAAHGIKWFSSIHEAQKAWVRVSQRIQPDYHRHQQYLEWISDRERIAERTD